MPRFLKSTCYIIIKKIKLLISKCDFSYISLINRRMPFPLLEF